jgi:hypothetical protein
MAARYRSAVWHDQIRTMSRGVGRTGGGLVICERVGGHDRWNVEVGRDPYTHIQDCARCLWLNHSCGSNKVSEEVGVRL